MITRTKHKRIRYIDSDIGWSDYKLVIIISLFLSLIIVVVWTSRLLEKIHIFDNKDIILPLVTKNILKI
jgi:hypothetical protein